MIHHSSGEHLGKSGFLEVGRSNTLRANCLFHELVDCTLRFIAFRTEICFGSLHILSDVMSIYVILGIFSIQYFSSHPFSSFGSYTFLPFLQSLQIYILWSKWRKSPLPLLLHFRDLPRRRHLAPLPSYGQLEIVLEPAAAGGSGASKFHNPAPSTSNTTQSSTPHHLWHSSIMNTIYSMYEDD